MLLVTGHIHPDTQFLVAALKIAAYTVVVPVALAIMLLAFAATLLDCAWFRLRTALTRRQHRKGVWEF